MSLFDNPLFPKTLNSFHNNYSQYHLHPYANALYSKNSKWQEPLVNTPVKPKQINHKSQSLEIIDW